MKFHDAIYTRAKELSLTFAPTGCEKRALDLLQEELKDVCECSRDRIGNLVCRLPGTLPRYEKGGAPDRIAFVCGVDEAGFMITKIDDKGYLRFERTGDADPSCFLAKKVLAGNEENLFEGIGGGKVLHLTEGSERTDAQDFCKYFVDLGMTKKEDLDGKLEPGDFVSYKGDYFELPNGYIVGKALETRMNCAILVELLRLASQKAESERHDLTVIFAVKEKVGFSGAVTALHRIRPDRAVVLGFEPVDLPADKEKERYKNGAEAGKGPVLALKDGRALFYDSDFFARAKACAVQKQILEASLTLSSSGGHLTAEGVPMISLRLPCYNPETPLVIVKKQDAENMLWMLWSLAVCTDDREVYEM